MYLDSDQIDKCMRYVEIQAFKFHQTTGIPVDELEAQGKLALAEAIFKHDPTRGSLFTLFYVQLKRELIDYCAIWKRQIPPLTFDGELPDVPCESFMERDLYVKEYLSTLSEEAQMVAKILFEDGADIVKKSKSSAPKHQKSALKRHLKDNLMWCRKEIDRAFEELSIAVKLM